MKYYHKDVMNLMYDGISAKVHSKWILRYCRGYLVGLIGNQKEYKAKDLAKLFDYSEYFLGKKLVGDFNLKFRNVGASKLYNGSEIDLIFIKQAGQIPLMMLCSFLEEKGHVNRNTLYARFDRFYSEEYSSYRLSLDWADFRVIPVKDALRVMYRVLFEEKVKNTYTPRYILATRLGVSHHVISDLVKFIPGEVYELKKGKMYISELGVLKIEEFLRKGNNHPLVWKTLLRSELNKFAKERKGDYLSKFNLHKNKPFQELDSEGQYEVVLAAKAGSREAQNFVFASLQTSLEKIIYFTCRQYNLKKWEMSELINVSFIGVHDALQRFSYHPSVVVYILCTARWSVRKFIFANFAERKHSEINERVM